jgi:hypothetical protein
MDFYPLQIARLSQRRRSCDSDNAVAGRRNAMAHNMLHGHNLDLADADWAQPGQDDQDDRGGEAPVTFNQFATVNHLHAVINADGSGDEHFILEVKGVEQNGAPLALPGLGSSFGMYFIIDGTLAPSAGPPITNSFNIALMVDPGNNDGAASATQSGVGFANGTAGDFALATGSLVSASLSLNAVPVPGTRHANFVEQMTPTKAGLEAFAGSLHADDLLQELLTTLPTNITSTPVSGGSIQVVNGATGIAQLTTLNSLRLLPNELSHGPHG